MSKMSDSKIVTLFLSVRKVAAGHRLVANGWALFKEAIEGAGEGDLPQLLHHLRGVMTPMLPPQTMDVPQASILTPIIDKEDKN